MLQQYNGLEVDMLAIGEGDCILVTKWENGRPMRALIDGGPCNAYEMISDFLHRRGIKRIDHMIATHAHDDHVAGLIRLIENNDVAIDHAWMHAPREDQTSSQLSSIDAHFGWEDKNSPLQSARRASQLRDLCTNRQITVSEPYAGDSVGFLRVCWPPRDHSWQSGDDPLYGFSDAQDSAYPDVFAAGNTYVDENNRSVITWVSTETGLFLFTADAGRTALNDIMKQERFAELSWMQIPHHGGRDGRNYIGRKLIEYFAPRVAFVSAGRRVNQPHPDVVAEFKANGAEVYGTNKCSASSLWHYAGRVPERPEYQRPEPL